MNRDHRLSGQVLVGGLLTLSLALLPTIPASSVQAAHSVIVSENPADNTPHVLDGQVRTMAVVGTSVVVGGTFTQIQDQGSTTVLDQPYLFAFDRATGRIDTDFLPELDDRVEAVAAAPGGQSVFVGGYFGTVNGVPRNNLTKLSVATGVEDSTFRSTTSSHVRDLVVRNGVLFVAGAFCMIRGDSRCGVAAVDPISGRVNPNLDLPFTDARSGIREVTKIDVTPDGSKLVAIGNFTLVDGLDRMEVAVLDLGKLTKPAKVANWETDRWKAACSVHTDHYITDVDISPNGRYFVLVSRGAGFPGTLCDTATRWELSASGSALEPTWADYTGGDSLTAVAVTGRAVYVGGHQRWMNNRFGHDAEGPGAVPRSGLAALDPVNGLPYSWNPGRSRGRGVFELIGTPDGLYLGSDTSQLGGEVHARLGFFPVAGGTAVPVAKAGKLPGGFFQLGASGTTLVRRQFDGSTFGAPANVSTAVDWSDARGAFMLSGKLYTGWDDGKLYVRTFNGSTVGPAVDLATTSTSFDDVTGMFYWRGRLFYTRSGDRNLYFRYFTPESGVVGTDEFVASGESDGLDWSSVSGMTLASGLIYFGTDGPGASGDGNLYAIPWRKSHPVAGTEALVSGPDAGDGLNWMAKGLFVLSP